MAGLAASMLLLFASALAPDLADAQVSPGPLARAHAALGGPLDCMKCHAKGDKGLDRQCLACHREVAATLEARRGLHGKAQLGQCAKCHPDHAGEEFEMIAWPEGSQERFDHSKTIFVLKGKHRSLACRECHNAKLSVSPIAALTPRKDRSRGYIGLGTSCTDCHADPHREVLGDNCERCHSQDAWKPTSGLRHQDTSYPLTGKHAATQCDACHRAERLRTPVAANGKREPLWKPLSHEECSACHADPHRDRLGPACSTCHVTDSFQKIDRRRLDHDKTRYPLRGKHRSVECAKCHDEKSAWGKKPRFEKCADCHEQAHAKEALLAGKPVDCDACHGVERFAPSTYTAVMHAGTNYPLEGKHRTVACQSCHPKMKGVAAEGLGPAAVLMRPRHNLCTDCHEDPHRGRFGPRGDRPYEKQCVACHSVDAFRPARFGLDEHSRSAFPLERAHRSVPCLDCHEALRARGPATVSVSGHVAAPALEMRERFARCSDCHETPHGKQFDDRGERGDCDTCHGVDGFVPAGGFDHVKLAAFALTGEHVGVACKKCHPERKGAGGTREVVYRPIAHQCQDCHGAAIPAAGGKPK